MTYYKVAINSFEPDAKPKLYSFEGTARKDGVKIPSRPMVLGCRSVVGPAEVFESAGEALSAFAIQAGAKLAACQIALERAQAIVDCLPGDASKMEAADQE